ncbi:mevalonate kinase [Ardenticatena maritima]|uniref:Mevalonate kinase n=1 Tax=Ardenticatena maritima TaxID=872965 RepID=A0A0M8KB07_9CHLR|nr:mevalonate kinase [Ardenticatena maritima]GAP64352.1 mevalonate kinase [Ardenticatena maritima]
MRGRGSAPGKIILLGEHAVVYGRPAIAVPISDVRASAIVQPGRRGAGIVIHALDIGRHYLLDAAPPTDPIACVIREVLTRCEIAPSLDLDITISSEIPIASGMGSGAAVATAVVRALFAAFGCPVDNATISEIVYQSETLLHGTPSGIDNTVVAYERPIWFVRGTPPTPFHVGGRFHLLIADTGVPSPTRLTVGDVRAAWERDRERYEALFDEIGALVASAREALQRGDTVQLGMLMQRNHTLLRQIGVSADVNDRLVEAALDAGAYGAKLSGGGRGGNVIALVDEAQREVVAQALQSAGAVRLLSTTLIPEEPQP